MSGKADRLRRSVAGYVEKGLLVAFSGGVDSTVVLQLALEQASARRQVLAVTIRTPFHPVGELEACRDLAASMKAPFDTVTLTAWPDAALMTNPPDRCYRCKRALFSTLRDMAAHRGLAYVADGAHRDDRPDQRPGMRAVRELGIVSPLAEAGFDKQAVRALARDLGLAVAEKPSAPCLATRLPYGATVSAALLERIEAGENALKDLGFDVIRLRVHGDVVRIEVDPARFSAFVSQRSAVIDSLRRLGFHHITLDLSGFRSGSMDETAPLTAPVTADRSR